MLTRSLQQAATEAKAIREAKDEAKASARFRRNQWMLFESDDDDESEATPPPRAMDTSATNATVSGGFVVMKDVGDESEDEYENDMECFQCGQPLGEFISCDRCPHVYHAACLEGTMTSTFMGWHCPPCEDELQADEEVRSRLTSRSRLANLSHAQLLNFAVDACESSPELKNKADALIAEVAP